MLVEIGKVLNSLVKIQAETNTSDFIKKKRLSEEDFEKLFTRLRNAADGELPIGLGAYTADRIPVLGSRPEGAIINTATFSSEGQHWIALFVEDGRLEIFDSGGRGPAMINEEISKFADRYDKASIRYNGIPFQDPNSEVCGFYSIFFILAKMNRLSMEDVIKELQLTQNSDEYVEKVVKEVYHSAEKPDFSELKFCNIFPIIGLVCCLVIILIMFVYVKNYVNPVQAVSFDLNADFDNKCNIYDDIMMDVD